MGGLNSVDTLIISNCIHSGSKEGIFLVEGGNVWILRNQIYNNADGIFCSKSVPTVSKNEIYQNKGCGIII